MAKRVDKQHLTRFLAENGHAWDYAGPLADGLIRALATPSRNRIKFDTVTKGFGIRVTAFGGKAFVFVYRTPHRQQRTYTIGAFDAWNTDQAREKANALKRQVQDGKDPQAEKGAERAAPLMNELIDRFVAEHVPLKRPSTRHSYLGDIRRHVRPTFGWMPVSAVTAADIQRLHQKILTTKNAPYAANRVVQVTSAIFTFAIKHNLRADNPAIRVERVPEVPRERYLTEDEIGRIFAELDRPRQGVERDTSDSANAVRMMLLTGARTTEVLSSTWDQFDLEAGVWTKQAPDTKQNRIHRVPLAPAVVALLLTMRKAANGGRFVFPGIARDGHVAGAAPRKTVLNFWQTTCRRAGVPVCRGHDLRHTFASRVVSSGTDLYVLSKLLGHNSIVTTQRYAHLLDDTLRAAVNRVPGGAA